jgi:hypothetical protein
VVDAASGAPLPGAVVSLSGLRFAGASVLADAHGRFVIVDVPPGAYTLAAQRIGYFDGLAGEAGPLLETTALRAGAGGVRRIELASGEWIPDINVGLWRPASIEGRILDEAGRPAVGRYVRVLAVSGPPREPEFALAGAALTDDRGTYAVGRLLEGNYAVAVLPDGETVLGGSAIPLMFHPGVRTLSDARMVSLEYGQHTTDVDIQTKLVPTRVITGRIVGASEAYANLTLALIDEGAVTLGTTGEVARTTAGSDGAFRFQGIPEGRYQLVSLEGSNRPDSRPASQLLGGPRLWERPGASPSTRSSGVATHWVHASIVVGPEDLVGLSVEALPTIDLAGRIIRDSAEADTVRMPRSVRLLTVGASRGFVPTFPVSEDGSFNISGLAGASYWLEIADAVVQEVLIDGRDYRFRPIDARAVRGELSITVTAGGSIAGTVSPPPSLSRPVLQSVIYFTEDRTKWPLAHRFPALAGHVPIGPDGGFDTRARLPEGNYYVVAAVGLSTRDRLSEGTLTKLATAAKIVRVSRGSKTPVDLRLTGVGQ